MTSATLLTNAREVSMPNPEFYLIRRAEELTDELADAVYEAGFDDSSLIMRGGRAAIWIRRRGGDFNSVVREALRQANAGGVQVDHVGIDNEVFAAAQ
jgi:hypothetical protein